MTTLSRKFNRVNVLATAIVLVIISVLYYLTLQHYLHKEADEDLLERQAEILEYVDRNQALPPVTRRHHLSTTYRPVPPTQPYQRFVTKDYPGTSDYRRLVFTLQLNGQQVEVTIQKSLEDFIELFGYTMIVTLITLAMLLVIITTLNSFILRALLKPFFAALETMKSFRLGARQPVHFPATDVEEFAQLNSTMEYAIANASKDYQILREFTENAAHELQTPLSVVRSKLEVIIQDDHVSEKQLRAADAAFTALTRLSGLNRSLLLLAKIENGYFVGLQPLDLEPQIAEKLADLEDIIGAKHIAVAFVVEGRPVLNLNPQLCDVLLNNLLGNAIEHNREGGSLRIDAGPGMLSISNSGRVNQELDRSMMFRRFARQGNAQARTGLGLAIIFEVCRVSGIALGYEFRDGEHVFVLRWQQPGNQ